MRIRKVFPRLREGFYSALGYLGVFVAMAIIVALWAAYEIGHLGSNVRRLRRGKKWDHGELMA